MTATCEHSITPGAPALYLAFELGANEWKLGFSAGLGVAARLRTTRAGDLAKLQQEIELNKRKFRLGDDVPRKRKGVGNRSHTRYGGWSRTVRDRCHSAG
jgi:hypothetical protein